MNAQRAERRQNLTERVPMLISDLHVWLREFTATHFQPRPRAKKPRQDFRLGMDSVHKFLKTSNERASIYETYPRTFLEVFVDEAERFLVSDLAISFGLDTTHVDKLGI